MKDRIMTVGEAGIQAADEKMKVLVNNMVNSKTPGFRKSSVSVRSFPFELESAQNRLYGHTATSMLPKVEGTFYNHIQGSLMRTGGPMDLAIGGNGFFAVSASWGDGFTRDGRFYVDAEGRLATVSGNYQMQGRSGPIVVNPGSKVEFSPIGEVKVDDVVVDTIRVVEFDNPQALQSVNGSVFRDTNNTAGINEVESPRVIQGYIEASNVNVVDEMMELIYLSRIYAIDTKIVQTRDQNLSSALNLGTVQ